MSDNLSDMWNKSVQYLTAADETSNDTEQLTSAFAKLERSYEDLIL